jgi:arylsulfatase A-like enzyme
VKRFIAAFALTLLATSATAAEKPNIVLLLIDDMGVMDSSVPFLTDAKGKPERHPLNDFYRTPNMERLASLGVRFSQFNSMSVCSPTRISLLTGQNAARHRTTNWINPDQNNGGPQGPPDWEWQGLKPGDVTLPAMLREIGYRTIHVGKGHFGPRDLDGSDPAKLGFDVNVGGASFGAPGSYYGEKNFARSAPTKAKGKAKRADHSVPHLDHYHGKDIFLTEALTLEAKAHVSDAVTAKKPFFLYFPHYGVHAPFESDPRFAANYRDSGKEPPAQAFATLVEGVDKSLGDLLDHLNSLGVAEDTLVIFLGDNGTDAPLGHQHEVACAAPLRGKKGSHYEGGVRVPFLAAWAQPNETNPHQKKLPIPPNSVQTQLAAVHDLFPTLLGLSGATAPSSHIVDGQKLDKLLSGKPDPDRIDSFLMHYPHAPHRTDYFTTYREQDWKVVYHYFPTEVSGGQHYQLFHLQADPYEQNDLASSSPEQLKRLAAKLVSALKTHEALLPVQAGSGQPVTIIAPP